MAQISRDEDDVARVERAFFVTEYDVAVSVEDEDFMFPLVAVEGCVSSGRHFEEPHGEVFRPILLGDEPSDPYVLGAVFRVHGFDLTIVDQLQSIHL